VQQCGQLKASNKDQSPEDQAFIEQKSDQE
jgi:hypothetical protein